MIAGVPDHPTPNDTSGYRWTSTDTRRTGGSDQSHSRLHRAETWDTVAPQKSARSLPLAATDPNTRGSSFAIRYPHVDIYRSARKHGVTDADIVHALGAAEQDDGKVIYLGADRAGNMLGVVAVIRDDDTEVVIHALRRRRIYEPLLREMRGTDD